MKIKHLLLTILINFLIYLDYLWYCFVLPSTQGLLAVWYFINILVFIIFLVSFINYLFLKTMFFENLSEILNKKIL